MQEDGIKKLYYAIGEVSEALGEVPHVLRYWESVFDVLTPRKSRAGKRIYTEGDIAVLRRIQFLLREEKYTIEGAVQVLAREHETPEQTQARRQEVLELRGFLEKLLQSL